MAVTMKKTGPTSAELWFVTAVPPQAVYEYLADFEKHHEWSGELVRMENLTPGPIRVGTEYKTIEAMRPGSRMQSPTFCEVVALDPWRHIEWRARTGVQRGPVAMRSHWEFWIEPDGSGSRVTQRMEMEPPTIWSRAFLRFFVLVADGLMGGLGASPKNVKKHVEKLDEVLAATTASS